MYGCLHSKRSLPEHALFELASSFTPRVESVGSGTVLLDLHGLGRAWPAAENLGQALLEAGREAGLDPHVALAGSRVAALIVARTCAGLTIVPSGQEAAVLAPLPLSALDLPPERQGLFERWGLRTLGDLAAMPAEGLAERLGPQGPQLIHVARGEDRIPLTATAPPESFQCSLELDWPVEGLEPLAFLLSRVLEPLCGRLRARGRQAIGMELKLRLVDGRTHCRTLRAAAPSAEPRTWRTLLLLDLEGHPPEDAIQALILHAQPTASRTVQFSLLDPAQPSPERLAETLAQLREWTVSGHGGAALLLDTHRPGAFVLQGFTPGPWRDPGPSSPEPCMVLRVFRPPLFAEVSLREGAPAFIRASGIHGPVTDRAGPWRASGDWWDVAWSREEWDVALSSGGLYRIYRDRLREAWFVEGELD